MAGLKGWTARYCGRRRRIVVTQSAALRAMMSVSALFCKIRSSRHVIQTGRRQVCELTLAVAVLLLAWRIRVGGGGGGVVVELVKEKTPPQVTGLHTLLDARARCINTASPHGGALVSSRCRCRRQQNNIEPGFLLRHASPKHCPRHPIS